MTILPCLPDLRRTDCGRPPILSGAARPAERPAYRASERRE
ncbi:MAG TPA: hypothetical protein VLY45_06060 [Nitrospiria bacterium]|nr:hypothetical protein [Nitrospiria bacterium]